MFKLKKKIVFIYSHKVFTRKMYGRRNKFDHRINEDIWDIFSICNAKFAGEVLQNVDEN